MRALAILALLAVVVTPVAGAEPVDEALVTAIARQLRCVVCQNLSVADSPSEMARQMRDLVRERLAQGDTPEQVRAYFVEKYGEWVLLSPRPRGFNLLVWILPFAFLAGGIGLVLVIARRWSRRPAAAAVEPEAPGPRLDEADRARVRAELERLSE